MLLYLQLRIEQEGHNLSFIYLAISILFIGFISAISKVEEANFKDKIRKKFNNNFAFLSTKAYMQLIVFICLLPLAFFIDWSVHVAFTIAILSMLRFVFWVFVFKLKGHYQDAQHQGSSNFTMLENFAGPLGALLVYGVFNAFNNAGVSVFWYVLTPFIGIFLLWSLRAEEESITKEMVQIILSMGLLVCAEMSIILYLQNTIVDYAAAPFSFLPFFNAEMVVFLMIIAISALFCSVYFIKDIFIDYRMGAFKQGIFLGFLSGVHDVFYFTGFMFFGPIFLIARRGVLIPLQNLYINLKDGHNLIDLLKGLYSKPLLSKKGGKDFIISFVDLVFNQTVKFIIKLLS